MAITYQDCPLTEAHCQQLSELLTIATKGAKLARDCAECDMPTQDFLDFFQRAADQIAKIKAKFFPQMP